MKLANTTVIDAADRFRRENDGIWVSLRSGGVGPLADHDAGRLIRRILEETAAEYPGTGRVLAVEWDDRSCCHLDVLFESDACDAVEIKGSVTVDDGYYEVTLTPTVRVRAA